MFALLIYYLRFETIRPSEQNGFRVTLFFRGIYENVDHSWWIRFVFPIDPLHFVFGVWWSLQDYKTQSPLLSDLSELMVFLSARQRHIKFHNLRTFHRLNNKFFSSWFWISTVTRRVKKRLYGWMGAFLNNLRFIQRKGFQDNCKPSKNFWVVNSMCGNPLWVKLIFTGRQRVNCLWSF